MKKLMMLLLCGGLLVACSSDSGYSVKVSKSDDAMITGSELKMTKQDYFNQLLDQYSAKYHIKYTFYMIFCTIFIFDFI